MEARVTPCVVAMFLIGALASAAARSDTVFDGGLTPRCADLGWVPRKLSLGQPASLDFSAAGGWIIGCEGLSPPFASLRFRVHAEAPAAQFLEVQLDGDATPAMPRVSVARGDVEAQGEGWTGVTIPLALLNPTGASFQRVIFRASRPVMDGPVLFDSIALLPATVSMSPKLNANPVGVEGGPNPKPPDSSSVARSRDHRLAGVADARMQQPADAGQVLAPDTSPPPGPVAAPKPTGENRYGDHQRGHSFTVRCDLPSHSISPAIYGVGYADVDEKRNQLAKEIGAAARRWGGNTTTRYNWSLGNVWNTASDWFFENVGSKPGSMWKRFIEMNDSDGVSTAITVPIIGWVAKDHSSVGFPVSKFGPQKSTDPDNPEAGNGVSNNEAVLEPLAPTQTSVAAPPSFIGDWVRAIRALKGPRRTYILDNEPALWSSTHRDVHPAPVSYDELLERTLAYAKAVHEADPDGLIAGPAEWGWSGYFWSAKDLAGHGLKLDRIAHGNKPLIQWWLAKIAAEEKRSHERLLDILDVHFYPQSEVGIGTSGGTDEATAARRIRSTRGLWDPTYADESWIAEPIELLPRMKRWIAESHPGLSLSIGEWNFGAENHMSGGLATAEALGLFGEFGVGSAYYWTVPAEKSAAAWAFRAFRNFDGAGGHFLDRSVATEGKDKLESLFVSREGAHLIAVLLNFDRGLALDARVDLSTCGPVASARVFSYGGGPAGFAPAAPPASGKKSLRVVAAPYSMTVLDMQLQANAPTGR